MGKRAFPRSEFARFLNPVAVKYLEQLITAEDTDAAVAALEALTATLSTDVTTLQTDVTNLTAAVGEVPLYARPIVPPSSTGASGRPTDIYMPLIDGVGQIVLSPDGRIIPKLWGTTADA